MSRLSGISHNTKSSLTSFCIRILRFIALELLVSGKTFKRYLTIYIPRTADILNV